MQKPVAQSDLLETMLRLTGSGHFEKASQFSPVGEITREYRKLKILLAEDGEVNRHVAIGLLTRQGHEVVVATDGAEAVAALDEQVFDLVLMDVQMPNLDGLEATKIIRQKEQAVGRHTPIIAMTAGAMKGDEERCLESGMDNYLSKPIQPKMLYDAIEQCAHEQVVGPSNRPQHDVVEIEEYVAPGDAMALEQPDVPEHPELTRDADLAEALGMINIDAARQLCRGDDAKVRFLAETLMREAADLIHNMREAVDSHDADSIRRCAHTLKGAAAVFDATGVVENAIRLEAIATEKNLDDIETPFAILSDEVGRLIMALESLTLPE
jgi:CheY-like chemotaxis protein/HPt (histidine-containing phosphotransfer) domain-containing protein